MKNLYAWLLCSGGEGAFSKVNNGMKHSLELFTDVK